MSSQISVPDQSAIQSVVQRIYTLFVLLLDTSGSTHGDRIAWLNRGIALLPDALRAETPLHGTAYVAVVTYSTEAHVVTDFTEVLELESLGPFVAGGGTNTGKALQRVVALTEAFQGRLAAEGKTYNPPAIVHLHDGAPSWPQSKQGCDEFSAWAQTEGATFVGVGLPGYNREQMERTSPPGSEIVEVDWSELPKFFRLVSESLSNSVTTGAFSIEEQLLVTEFPDEELGEVTE